MSRIQFDAEAIRALAQILRDTGLTEIELVDKENRVRLVRTPAPATAPTPVQAAAPVAAAVAAQAAVPPTAEAATPAGAVPSPMVGVAYLSSEPGAEPFVILGQAVAAGQTILLIEAMKTFNQIKAPRAGTLTRILVTSGQPVEYDQPLFVIE